MGVPSLSDLGQLLWLDNITRDLLNNGSLNHYMNDRRSQESPQTRQSLIAIKSSTAYDAAILEWAKKGKTGRIFSSNSQSTIFRDCWSSQ